MQARPAASRTNNCHTMATKAMRIFLETIDLSAVIDSALTAFGPVAPSQLALTPNQRLTWYFLPVSPLPLARVELREEALASHGCKNRTCGPPAAASCKPISQTTRAKQRTSIASHARLFDLRWNCSAARLKDIPYRSRQKPAESLQRPVSCTDLYGRTLGAAKLCSLSRQWSSRRRDTLKQVSRI
jgi:hypothetical protein